jgi:hypothetical protein
VAWRWPNRLLTLPVGVSDLASQGTEPLDDGGAAAEHLLEDLFYVLAW